MHDSDGFLHVFMARVLGWFKESYEPVHSPVVAHHRHLHKGPHLDKCWQDLPICVTKAQSDKCLLGNLSIEHWSGM